MKHPGRLFVQGTGPAGTEDGLPVTDDLGLYKEVAEGGMERVRGGRCKNDFGVTCDVDRPACPRTVGDSDPAQFDVVLG
ncbi:MAG: hypothetical protein PHC68_09005 [Syntrophorhabdaceae bacterium]|nr:hypothetical protein [Syntrophorhabdaceae bacterium]